MFPQAGCLRTGFARKKTGGIATALPSGRGRRAFSAGLNFMLIFNLILSSSTEVKFGKNLIRIWVEFGKKMVPRNQAVEGRQN